MSSEDKYDSHLKLCSTSDGSATFWSEKYGESFRSRKGAFNESFKVFVEPTLEHLKSLKQTQVTLIEFGLGVGTNWLLWSLISKCYKIKSTYFAIENDPDNFKLAKKYWSDNKLMFLDFLEKLGLEFDEKYFFKLLNTEPVVFESLDEALKETLKADIWFHDPFGISSNPDPYQKDFMLKASKLWAGKIFGASYACNRALKDSLSALESVDWQVKRRHKTGATKDSLVFYSGLDNLTAKVSNELV